MRVPISLLLLLLLEALVLLLAFLLLLLAAARECLRPLLQGAARLVRAAWAARLALGSKGAASQAWRRSSTDAPARCAEPPGIRQRGQASPDKFCTSVCDTAETVTCAGGCGDDGLGRPAGRDQDARAPRRERRAAQLADSCFVHVIFECMEYRILRTTGTRNATTRPRAGSAQPAGARGWGNERRRGRAVRS